VTIVDRELAVTIAPFSVGVIRCLPLSDGEYPAAWEEMFPGAPDDRLQRWFRDHPGDGDIAIGGATLAAEAAAAGPIDEYRAMVYPVLVGGGIPFFPKLDRRMDLELVEARTFGSRFVYLRYRVAR
jgi:hypothetical protein